MIVCVCNVEFSVCHAQAARFVKERGCAVHLSGLALAEERLDGVRLRVKLFDLVIVSVCNQNFLVEEREAEWMLQAHFVAFAVNVSELEEVAARERLYL